MVNTMTTVKISVSCICQDSSNTTSINEICSLLIKMFEKWFKIFKKYVFLTTNSYTTLWNVS